MASTELNIFLSSWKFEQVELAKLLGISNTKLSLILSGKQKADLQFIKSIHKELKINAEFILQSI